MTKPAVPHAIAIPPALRKGDLVGVTAPGSTVDRASVEAGLRVLEQMGLRTILGPSLFARDGFFAGSDEARASDLLEMLESDDIRAIHFARGGWGTSRLLGSIPWKTLTRNPKLLVGYSDLTSLFAPAIDRAGVACVYGPLISEMGFPARFDRASLARAYFRPRERLIVRVPRSAVWRDGRAEGVAAGGCLTLLAHLAGTPFAPRLAGRILLIEEIGEPPYRIDRMLTQLRLAGALDGVAGVMVGSLTDCVPPPGARTPSAREAILAAFGDVPIVAAPPFGHIDRKVSVPLGVRVRIDTARGRAVFTP